MPDSSDYYAAVKQAEGAICLGAKKRSGGGDGAWRRKEEGRVTDDGGASFPPALAVGLASRAVTGIIGLGSQVPECVQPF